MRSCARTCVVELDQPEQLLGPVEREDLAAAGVGFEDVGELRDRAGGLVGERQRQAVVRAGPSGRPSRYLADCVSTPVSVWPFGLGLDDADGLAVGVEQVVGEPGGERELADGDAGPGGDVHRVVLHHPAGLGELAVDLLAGLLFGRHRALMARKGGNE